MLKKIGQKLLEIEGVRLIWGELPGLNTVTYITVPDLNFDIQLPMKVIEHYHVDGQKIPVATPSDLDVNNIRINSGGYYDFEVTRLYLETELPKFS